MRLRTKSKTEQWILWSCAVLAAVVLYVVLSDVLFDSVSWNVFDPERYRIAFPLVAAVAFFAWETRWDRIVREKKRRVDSNAAKGKRKVAETDGTDKPVGVVQVAENQEKADVVSQQAEVGGVEECPPAEEKRSEADQPTEPDAPESYGEVRQAEHFGNVTPVPAEETGEALYLKARSLPHRRLPDFSTDGYYLELLGEAARKGHSPALAKLGEYAMRRLTWIEAYFWMTQARRYGMRGIPSVLREIRKNWAMCGCPDELENVNGLFSAESSAIGRALLHIDTGKKVAAAREFLQMYHPEFLSPLQVIHPDQNQDAGVGL